MSLLSDTATEDLFYDNLTLGLTKILAQTPGVQNVTIDRRTPCERMLLSSWEQRHCCTLPQDLRLFYLSTDGFKLTWKYHYAGNILPLGNMKINSIAELKKIGGFKSPGDIDCPNLLDLEVAEQGDQLRPTFGTKCKIFELENCQNNGHVCLVYNDSDKPRIWLLDRSFEWHMLAETFSQYFRMMLVHQGLPQWQYRFASVGLTPFTEQMMTLLAPHLLAPEPASINVLSETTAANYLDPNILKSQKPSKNTKKKEVNKSK